MQDLDEQMMRRALVEAEAAAAAGEVPVGAVVAVGDQIRGVGRNGREGGQDPTAHAEIVAIRDACERLGTFQLSGCDLYASCEPCPMCLAAAYWSRVDNLFYAACREDASAAGFDDDTIYSELGLPHEQRSLPMIRLQSPDVGRPFEAWKNKADKIEY